MRLQRKGHQGAGKKLTARPERRLYFRLASLSGCASVDEFLARTTSRQISEWIAYRRLELLPDERIELLLASIAALLANQWRGEDDTPATPADFMPWVPAEPEPAESDPTHVDAMVDMLKRVFGAQEVTEDPGPALASQIAYRAKQLIDADRHAVSQETQ